MGGDVAVAGECIAWLARGEWNEQAEAGGTFLAAQLLELNANIRNLVKALTK